MKCATIVLKYPSRIAQRHSSAVNGTTSGEMGDGIMFVNIETAMTIVTTDVKTVISLELQYRTPTKFVKKFDFV
jgi:hypothetical protein